MNYRHVYHAGNFADVFKHAVMALVIEHLKIKPAPFRIVDTHAGTGGYDLGSLEAQKTGEWRDGIGRLLGERLPADIAEILAPYLSAIAAENPGCEGAVLKAYPGSPLIARHLMRTCDQLVVNELHPDDFEQLDALLGRDRQTQVLGIDGWTALKSLLPPKERRGLVLIDPPFEAPGELARMLQGLRDGVQRFATGTFVLWYPIKDRRPVEAFRLEAIGLGLEKLLDAELMVRTADGIGLAGCGLLIVNPPYTLPAMLARLLAYLAERLAQGPGAASRVTWLAREGAAAIR